MTRADWKRKGQLTGVGLLATALPGSAPHCYWGCGCKGKQTKVASTKESTMRKWGEDRGRASHTRRVNPKNTKHMCTNSGPNRVFQESLEGTAWGGGCAGVCGQAAGTCSGQGSEAEVETWGRQRVHKLSARKNAAWVAQEGSGRKMAGAGERTESSLSARHQMESRPKRLGLKCSRGLEGGPCQPATETDYFPQLFPS